MQNKRPKLTDPEEFALIKSIYFKDNRKELEDDERYSRQESRNRNLNNNAR